MPRPRFSSLRDIVVLLAPRWRVMLAGLALVLFTRMCGLVLPASMKLLIDNVIAKGNRALLPQLAGAVLGAGIAQAAASYAATSLLTRTGHQMVAELRLRLQAHMARLPLAWFERRRTGTLITHVMTDVENVRFLVGTGIVDFIGGLISGMAGIAVLLSFSPRLTAAVLVCLVVIGGLTRSKVRQFRPLIRERQRITGEVTGRLGEFLSGIRVVKAYAAEGRERSLFARDCQQILAAMLRTSNVQAVMSVSVALTAGLAGAIIMFLGADLVLDGSLTLGELLTFTVFLAMVVAPAMQSAGVAGQICEALASLDRCHEVFRQLPEDRDNRRVDTPSSWHGDIEFQNVRFSYGDGPPVLRGISFRAAPGTMTALVGPSGAGKSTITSLIAGFYNANDGRVLAGRTNLATIRLDYWRRQLGVVLQDTFLFDGSIRENVMFARPDAPTADFLHACRLAHVADFAESFSDGYETVVGERGVRLSGGQKQRISIARAILADPRVLILDEATSSLDSESEALIQQGLEFLIQGRTTFVIAHRLSTIRSADQILVLEDGEIVERGTHSDLYKDRGRYFELCSAQDLGIESARRMAEQLV